MIQVFAIVFLTGLLEPQKSLNDIFWRVGRNFLQDPKDLLNLALTNTSVYRMLYVSLWTAEIRKVHDEQQQRDATTCPYHGTHVEIYRDTLFPGRFHIRSSDCTCMVTRPMPLLHAMIEHGRVAGAQKLIKLAQVYWPAYLEIKMTDRTTPLLRAASLGHTEIVSTLVEAGCLLKTIPVHNLPLNKIMLRRNNPYFPDNQSTYPTTPVEVIESYQSSGDCLDVAILHGHTGLARWLIRETDVTMSQGQPKQMYILEKLYLAAWKNDIEIAALLLD